MDEQGNLAVEEWRKHRKDCTVRRFWAGQLDERGHLVHKRGGAWIFDYNPAISSDDEPGFKFNRHHFVPGEYVSVTEHDGVQRTFRIISVVEPEDSDS